MHELLGWTATLTDIDHSFLQNKRRRLSPVYASAELIWYLSRSAHIAGLLPYCPRYQKFAEKDNIAYGAYGARLALNISGGYDQLVAVRNTLQAHPDSRQAVVSLWRADDLIAALNLDKKDVPCTLTWQFLIRENRLHMITTMRSNDIWLGMPYDVYIFTCIQKLLASTLEIEPGEYVHQVGSMHMYDKDRAKCLEAVEEQPWSMPHKWGASARFDTIEKAVQVETMLRQKAITNGAQFGIALEESKLHQGLLHDSLSCIAKHWGIHGSVGSPALRKVLET